MTAPTAAMCACGKAWLLDGVGVFFAEGSEHTRNWCRRTESTAPHMVDIDPNPSPADPPGG